MWQVFVHTCWSCSYLTGTESCFCFSPAPKSFHCLTAYSKELFQAVDLMLQTSVILWFRQCFSEKLCFILNPSLKQKCKLKQKNKVMLQYTNPHHMPESLRACLSPKEDPCSQLCAPAAYVVLPLMAIKLLCLENLNLWKQWKTLITKHLRPLSAMLVN